MLKNSYIKRENQLILFRVDVLPMVWIEVAKFILVENIIKNKLMV